MSPLHELLGADLAVLDQLSADEADELHALIQTARTEQQAALDDAIEAALHHLPRLARIPARKILFG